MCQCGLVENLIMTLTSKLHQVSHSTLLMLMICKIMRAKAFWISRFTKKHFQKSNNHQGQEPAKNSLTKPQPTSTDRL
jgi:hypothetical protein